MQPHVQNVLNAGGEKHGQAAGLENVIALVGRGRALGDMVIACNRNDAAVLSGASHIGVLEHIRAAVYPGAFAVPNAKHTIKFFGFWIQVKLLRAPNRRSTQLFIHAGLKHNIVGCQVFFGSPQSLVIAAQRGASVTTDKPRRVQTRSRIARALQHWQANQRLHATHESASLVK